jgi:elongation factor Tu
MPISSVQPIKGRGTVLIGTVESGIVKKGDSLEVIGFEVKSKTTVSDIQIFNQACKSVTG